jgi:hypothetical protein
MQNRQAGDARIPSFVHIVVASADFPDPLPHLEPTGIRLRRNKQGARRARNPHNGWRDRGRSRSAHR